MRRPPRGAHPRGVPRRPPTRGPRRPPAVRPRWRHRHARRTTEDHRPHHTTHSTTSNPINTHRERHTSLSTIEHRQNRNGVDELQHRLEGLLHGNDHLGLVGGDLLELGDRPDGDVGHRTATVSSRPLSASTTPARLLPSTTSWSAARRPLSTTTPNGSAPTLTETVARKPSSSTASNGQDACGKTSGVQASATDAINVGPPQTRVGLAGPAVLRCACYLTVISAYMPWVKWGGPRSGSLADRRGSPQLP